MAQRVFVDLAENFGPRAGASSAAEGVRSVAGMAPPSHLLLRPRPQFAPIARRLRKVHAMELQQQVETGDWSRVAPVLEEALSGIAGSRTGTPWYWRFFEDEPYARIGSALDCSRTPPGCGWIRL